MEKVLLDWQRPGHPTAFSGLSQLGRYYKGRFSQAQLKNALSSVDAYTIKREAKKPVYNPIIVTRKREVREKCLLYNISSYLSVCLSVVHISSSCYRQT
jgi:hypothetical protein